ncbi:alanine racemase [Demequina aurantiaca]|uniref:alanine racemase n=1 Tax=Demequina aurantiaca TaxID=676200 RepID=UPI00078610C6|nr:alanine racemase [Demequina aurantiaca]
MSMLKVSVDYDAIAGNVATLRALAPTAKLMAVVKADAYGHGLLPSARAARRGGAEFLGVAQPSEAIALRDGGDEGRVLTWLYGPEVHAADLLSRDIDVSAGSLEVLSAIVKAARAGHGTATVHLCVDTGLGREGVPMANLDALLTAASAAQDEGLIKVVGMWSHLAWADQPGHPTVDAQAENFHTALATAEARGLDIELAHLGNSACTLTRPDLHFDMVRPGIAIYGLPPVEDPEGDNFGLTAAMSVSSTLALVKELPGGHGVSYGHEYVTPQRTHVGLVSAGYADGVFRAAGGVAEVSVRGVRYPIAGRVCMDQFVLDLGPETEADAGDIVTLIGPGGPTARDWATAIGTIDYEIVCRFGGLRPKTAE